MMTSHFVFQSGSIIFLVISAIFWIGAALKGFHKLEFITTPPVEAMGGSMISVTMMKNSSQKNLQCQTWLNAAAAFSAAISSIFYLLSLI
ncbi:MAG: hypothetical protein KIT56_07260 [Gammaproteobacteria bacterium]|nr:hypothetical protein [Gammaproteobacteria bacterium]MCW5583658.1 hypothetical protein [Gammaproteobacteria bacterium]